MEAAAVLTHSCVEGSAWEEGFSAIISIITAASCSSTFSVCHAPC